MEGSALTATSDDAELLRLLDEALHARATARGKKYAYYVAADVARSALLAYIDQQYVRRDADWPTLPDDGPGSLIERPDTVPAGHRSYRMPGVLPDFEGER